MIKICTSIKITQFLMQERKEEKDSRYFSFIYIQINIRLDKQDEDIESLQAESRTCFTCTFLLNSEPAQYYNQ